MLDDRGKRNLVGVHPIFARIVLRACDKLEGLQTIIDGGGVRSHAQAADNAARNAGILNSLHIPQADGWSHAVDLLPCDARGNPYWSVEAAKSINSMLFRVADDEGFPLQNGGDWNMNGLYGEPKKPAQSAESDHHHNQIPQPHKMPAAIAAMHRRRAERAAGINPDITPGLTPDDMRDEDFDDRPGQLPEELEL
jgi:peptidoglycan L-alanyl-D-glutamate endopeptidase CwlK